MSSNCRNCGKELVGNYCANCGQSASVGRIDLHSIVHEFLHGVLHVDKGIFYTMKELTLRPGITLKGYLEGKRVGFFKPFSYLFILSTIYIILMRFFKISIADLSVTITAEDGQDEELVRTVTNLRDTVFTIINDHYALINILMLPIMALCTYLFFRRDRFNYGEHLIINSYISGHVMLLNIILIPFAYFCSDCTSIISLMTFLLSVYMYVKVFDGYNKVYYRILRSVFCYFTLTVITVFITAMSLVILTKAFDLY